MNKQQQVHANRPARPLTAQMDSAGHLISATQLACRMFTDFSIQSLIGDQDAGAQPAASTAAGRRARQLDGPQTEAAKSASEPAASHRKYRPKNFQCPACKMAFSNNGQLKNHIRIHTGERPFTCAFPDCAKSFTRNEELTRHKLIHTGIRPHICTACGKRFGRKDHLKKHVKTHERKQRRKLSFESAKSKLLAVQPDASMRPQLPMISAASSAQQAIHIQQQIIPPPPVTAAQIASIFAQTHTYNLLGLCAPPQPHPFFWTGSP